MLISVTREKTLNDKKKKNWLKTKIRMKRENKPLVVWRKRY